MSEAPAKATVLLVDDEETILKMAGQRLRHAGYRVLTASNGTMGLVIAKAEHPDVILLDMNMPVMNGAAVLQTLKSDRQTRDIPVIMLTAVGAEAQITNSIDSGAVCYLVKPYQAKELIEEVANAVERHHLAHGQPPREAADVPPEASALPEEAGAEDGSESEPDSPPA